MILKFFQIWILNVVGKKSQRFVPLKFLLTHFGFQKQIKTAKDQILEKQAFLSRAIDVIRIIDKLGLPYKGSNNESAFSLADSTKFYFLELILLLSKYDNITENHVKECIKKSNDALFESKPGSKKHGRENLIILSKSTDFVQVN